MNTAMEIKKALEGTISDVVLLRAGNASVEKLTDGAQSDVLVLHTDRGGKVYIWNKPITEDEPYNRLYSRVYSVFLKEGQVSE